MSSDLEREFVKASVLSLYQHCDENVANLFRVITDTLRGAGRPDVRLDVDVYGAVLTVTQDVDYVLNQRHDFNRRAVELAAAHGSPARRLRPARETYTIVRSGAPTATKGLNDPYAAERELMRAVVEEISRDNNNSTQSSDTNTNTVTSMMIESASSSKNKTTTTTTTATTKKVLCSVSPAPVRPRGVGSSTTYNGDYILRRYGGKAYTGGAPPSY
eukprot:PhM_4_TR17761/c0_g1_i1/m.847